MFYYSGLNICPSIVTTVQNDSPIIEEYSELLIDNITDINIGWNYLLVWKDTNVYIYGKINELEVKKLLTVSDECSGSCVSKFTCGIPGRNSVTLLSIDNQLWQYKFYEDSWVKVDNFIPINDESYFEYIIKIAENHSVVALTNLGRVFNVPTLVEMPKRLKFIDIACGFEHTIMLSENGEIYSMGLGSRGQLGHGELEDCDEPKLIEALAGLKVVKISAGGWHNAIITDQGDVYTWGWNTNGELGVNDAKKISATPTVVDFMDDDNNEPCEMKVKTVECGNAFTLCISDGGVLWGCGSNKYGQLGQPRKNMIKCEKFVKLNVNINDKFISDIRCREWGSVIKF